MSLLDELADRWEIAPDTGCYLWLGGVAGRNRPRIKRNGITKKVARLICEELYGPPPTPKHEAAHDTLSGCVGKFCVNGKHLRWATRLENMSDISPRERHETALKAHAAQTPEQRSARTRKVAMLLTPEQRKERSRKMNAVRWGKQP